MINFHANKEMLDKYAELIFAGKQREANQLLHDYIRDMDEVTFARSVSDLFLVAKERTVKVTISFPCYFEEPENLLEPSFSEAEIAQALEKKREQRKV